MRCSTYFDFLLCNNHTKADQTALQQETETTPCSLSVRQYSLVPQKVFSKGLHNGPSSLSMFIFCVHCRELLHVFTMHIEFLPVAQLHLVANLQLPRLCPRGMSLFEPYYGSFFHPETNIFPD